MGHDKDGHSPRSCGSFKDLALTDTASALSRRSFLAASSTCIKMLWYSLVNGWLSCRAGRVINPEHMDNVLVRRATKQQLQGIAVDVIDMMLVV